MVRYFFAILSQIKTIFQAEYLVAINPAKERGNANRISEYSDAPINFYSATDETMSYALTSTAKKDKKDKKKKRQGGDEESSGNILAVVQSERAKDDPLESNNAEFGLQTNLTQKQIKELPESLFDAKKQKYPNISGRA